MKMIWCILMVLAMTVAATAQNNDDTAEATKGKLLVVGTAHLDTQWRWTIKTTIDEFIPNTFRDNFELMDQFPDYVFSFEGAFRYMLIKEYYPEAYERLRGYIARERWRVTGSWLDAVDVNLPSFESLVRHSLYGNGYFESEFGKTSTDIFLPDCFGFGYALPSIANHCGIKSFSTQKLTWGSWVGIPFDIGIWEGVDGSTLICGINPGSYGSTIEEDLSRDTVWSKKIEQQGDSTGLYVAYKYFGTGDVGGSPDSASVDWLQKSIHSDGPVEVLSVGADDIAKYVEQAEGINLPHYKGELVMTRHGVGCYTSQAAMKRWNRKNELLADGAERASVMAYLGAAFDYPRDYLRDTWTRFLWHQFHDDLTGTSIPEAYEYSWNDEILCLNRFAAVQDNAVTGVTSAMDTRVEGVPLVIYNPLSIEREDVVEATVHLTKSTNQFVRLFDDEGNEVPSDLLADYGDSVAVIFPARLPSIGFSVYDLRLSDQPSTQQTGLTATSNSLENSRYRVQVNSNGEIASVWDKSADCELLSEPFRFEMFEDSPERWPAWEIDYDDIGSAPLNEWIGPAEIRIVEDGLVRVSLEIVRRTAHSTITTRVSLAAGGASDRVELDCDIDWYERGRLLKATLSSATPNDSVTYDIGLGTITRGLNIPELYEVPGQQWADLSSTDNSYGVAFLNDCRYGWDHPEPDKLRLTLVHTPKVADGWSWVEDERSQDNGHHDLKLALYGHDGDWRQGDVIWQAARFNQPMVAYQTTTHDGSLGKQYSLLSIRTYDVNAEQAREYPTVMINAVKMAEESDKIVIRVRELNGEATERVKIMCNDLILIRELNGGLIEHATIRFSERIHDAIEVDGREKKIGDVEVVDGALRFAMNAYQPKAFALTMDVADFSTTPTPSYIPLTLPYNLDGISRDDGKCDGDFDGQGNSIAGELIPDTVWYQGIPFLFGSSEPGKLNTVKCESQTIDLSSTDGARVCLVGASVGGPTIASFGAGEHDYTIAFTNYLDPVGRWNSRMMGDDFDDDSSSIAPAYINQQPVAWYGSHMHTVDCENEAYRFAHLFLIELDVPSNATSITLPDDQRVRIMAATVVDAPYPDVRRTMPLYDQANNTLAAIHTDSSSFAGSSSISLSSPIPGAEIHFTIDGSEPTSESNLYNEPFVVEKTSTIKARAMLAGANDNYVASLAVTKLGLKEALAGIETTSGLAGRYYEGEWKSLPDFGAITPVREFVSDSVFIPEFASEEDYGLTYEGYVRVPHDGVYSFSISSDDGSRLWVADSLLADNDGLHGDYEMGGLIGLKAGYHSFRAVMFQGKGGEALRVTIAGPSMPKQTLKGDLVRR